MQQSQFTADHAARARWRANQEDGGHPPAWTQTRPQTAASLDQGSEHPLAHSIVAAAKEGGLALWKAEEFDSGFGIGVSGRDEDKSPALGNLALMKKLGVRVAYLSGSLRSCARKERSCEADERESAAGRRRAHPLARLRAKRADRKIA